MTEKDLARIDQTRAVPPPDATAGKNEVIPSQAKALYRYALRPMPPRMSSLDVPILEDAADELCRLATLNAELVAIREAADAFVACVSSDDGFWTDAEIEGLGYLRAALAKVR